MFQGSEKLKNTKSQCDLIVLNVLNCFNAPKNLKN